MGGGSGGGYQTGYYNSPIIDGEFPGGGGGVATGFTPTLGPGASGLVIIYY
jgi:hypothetical protein